MVGIPAGEAALRRYPHEFSGGMRQRVMIATALALSPKLLIADEPTTALDVTIQAQVLELMGRRVRDAGAALMLVTHNLGVVAGMTQRVAVMYAGRIVGRGKDGRSVRAACLSYTVGLLHSLPGGRSRDGDLVPIPGVVPRTRPRAGGLCVRATMPVAPAPLLDRSTPARACRPGCLWPACRRASGRVP